MSLTPDFVRINFATEKDVADVETPAHQRKEKLFYVSTHQVGFSVKLGYLMLFFHFSAGGLVRGTSAQKPVVMLLNFELSCALR